MLMILCLYALSQRFPWLKTYISKSELDFTNFSFNPMCIYNLPTSTFIYVPP